MREAVIVSTARTPIGRAYRGAFNNLEGPSLAAHAIRTALERAGVERRPGSLGDGDRTDDRSERELHGRAACGVRHGGRYRVAADGDRARDPRIRGVQPGVARDRVRARNGHDNACHRLIRGSREVPGRQSSDLPECWQGAARAAPSACVVFRARNRVDRGGCEAEAERRFTGGCAAEEHRRRLRRESRCPACTRRSRAPGRIRIDPHGRERRSEPSADPIRRSGGSTSVASRSARDSDVRAPRG